MPSWEYKVVPKQVLTMGTSLILYEPRHEKTRLLPKQKQRRRYCTADQRVCFRYTDSTIPRLLKSEISTFYPSSETVQAGLCQTWSETPKTGFLMLWIIYIYCKNSIKRPGVYLKQYLYNRWGWAFIGGYTVGQH